MYVLTQKLIKIELIKILSAIGSHNLPKLEIRLFFRAK